MTLNLVEFFLDKRTEKKKREREIEVFSYFYELRKDIHIFQQIVGKSS